MHTPYILLAIAAIQANALPYMVVNVDGNAGPGPITVVETVTASVPTQAPVTVVDTVHPSIAVTPDTKTVTIVQSPTATATTPSLILPSTTAIISDVAPSVTQIDHTVTSIKQITLIPIAADSNSITAAAEPTATQAVTTSVASSVSTLGAENTLSASIASYAASKAAEIVSPSNVVPIRKPSAYSAPLAHVGVQVPNPSSSETSTIPTTSTAIDVTTRTTQQTTTTSVVSAVPTPSTTSLATSATSIATTTSSTSSLATTTRTFDDGLWHTLYADKGAVSGQSTPTPVYYDTGKYTSEASKSVSSESTIALTSTSSAIATSSVTSTEVVQSMSVFTASTTAPTTLVTVFPKYTPALTPYTNQTTTA